MACRAFVLAVAALAAAASAGASGPTDLHDAGPGTETVLAFGAGDPQDLARGTLYGASTFPVHVTVRPPDALWLGGQTQRGKFRFVVFQHKYGRDAQGHVAVWGGGEVWLEAGIGRTGSVAATVKRLRATPHIEADEPSNVRVAGFSGVSFDVTVTGTEPGETGQAFIPFSGNPKPGGDHMFVRKGQRLRIAVIGVRGKTAVIYIQPSWERLDRTFPAFVRSANRLLPTLRFPRS